MGFGTLVTVFLFVAYFKFMAVTGELVLERSPDCPGDPIVFRCSVSSGRLEWTWSVFPEQPFIRIPGVNFPGIRNFLLGNTLWIFNATNISASFINVIATIMEPLELNGTTTTCNGEILTINFGQPDLRPKSLTVTGNGSGVNLYPNIEDDINRVDYQISKGSRMVVTQPISVNALENITFFHCQENVTFTINAACWLEDNDERLNYTLFSNGTWEISRICGNIQVNCTNGNWSEDISCPEITTSDPINLTKPDTMITKNLYSATTNEDETTTTRTAEDSNIICPGCSSAVLTAIIGSVIGTFSLAFVLGNTVGLLCGIKYARRNPSEKPKEKLVISTDNENSNKGPLYEEVDVQKDLELQPNISYETVNKIASS